MRNSSQNLRMVTGPVSMTWMEIKGLEGRMVQWMKKTVSTPNPIRTVPVP